MHNSEPAAVRPPVFFLWTPILPLTRFHRLLTPMLVVAYAALGLLVAAVSLSSDVPLDIEDGPLSFVDAMLVFLLAGLLLPFALQRECRTPVRVAWLMATTTALGVGVIQLVGLLDGETPLVEEPDWGDLLCWFLAGGFVAWMIRTERIISDGVKLLLAGFVLQSFSVVADLTDGELAYLPDAIEWLFGPGEEVSEVFFLATYCMGFVLLIGEHARAALVSRERAPGVPLLLSPALAIARAREVARWRQWNGGWAAHLFVETAALPVAFAGQLVWHVARNGRRVARDAGRTLPQQIRDCIALGLGEGLPPRAYYMYELYDDARRRAAGSYVHRYQARGNGLFKLVSLYKPRAPNLAPLRNKAGFAAHCRRHGLACAPTVLLALNDGVAFADGASELPDADLLVKPIRGGATRGRERWVFLGRDRFLGPAGAILDRAALVERFRRRGRGDGLLVQRADPAHAVLARLGGARATLRVLSCLDENLQPEVTHALLRMPRFGGELVAPIDLHTGRLGQASDRGLGSSLGWIDRHPDTSAAIAGAAVPFWDDARRLVEKAHGCSRSRLIVGWEVAVTDEGAALIEATARPDFDAYQRAARAPLGNSRFGRLLAWHVVRLVEGR